VSSPRRPSGPPIARLALAGGSERRDTARGSGQPLLAGAAADPAKEIAQPYVGKPALNLRQLR
jgi:hypothetical protein